jgi:hypothetical protein
MVERSPESMIRIMPVNLSEAELEEMQALIDAGVLPPDHMERHFDAIDQAVHGVHAPIDPKTGKRIGIGLGSPTNQTQQSIDAFIRWCGPGKPNEDPTFEKSLARMRRELEQSNARRKAEAAANPKKKFWQR